MLPIHRRLSLPHKKVEETIKGEYLEVSNARIGITTVNARSQKLPVADQYTRELLSSGKIMGIGWVECRVRMRINPTRCYRWTMDKGRDRRKACRRCDQVGHQAKTWNENKNCVFCKDRGECGESVAYTAVRDGVQSLESN